MHLTKKSGRLSSTSPEILAFVSHCSANFQPILDCSIPKFKFKHEDSENIIADRLTIVVFNLHQIKRRAFFFLGHPVYNGHIFQKNMIYFTPVLIVFFNQCVSPYLSPYHCQNQDSYGRSYYVGRRFLFSRNIFKFT